MPLKRRKSDHTAAGGGKFHFFYGGESRPPLDVPTVLQLHYERSGVDQRRLHMTAVF